jgi:hypothetical protein
MEDGKRLVRFEHRHNLNTKETARIFLVTDRTVQSYRKMNALPKAFSVALRHLAYAADRERRIVTAPA